MNVIWQLLTRWILWTNIEKQNYENETLRFEIIKAAPLFLFSLL